MGLEIKILDISFPAAEDLSADQYKFVVLDSSKVRRPNSETEIFIGILQNAPGEGEAAVVRVLGISKLQMNAALASGFVKAEYVTAAAAGKGKTAAAALNYARAIVINPSEAEDDLADVLLISPVPSITAEGKVITVTSDSTVGARTYTAAELIGGMIIRDPSGNSRSDVSPTAANIVAGFTGAIVGSAFEFVIRNAADAAENITLTAGDANVTLSPASQVIAQNNSKRFLCVITNITSGQEAVTIYSLGTSVH